MAIRRIHSRLSGAAQHVVGQLTASALSLWFTNCYQQRPPPHHLPLLTTFPYDLGLVWHYVELVVCWWPPSKSESQIVGYYSDHTVQIADCCLVLGLVQLWSGEYRTQNTSARAALEVALVCECLGYVVQFHTDTRYKWTFNQVCIFDVGWTQHRRCSSSLTWQ